MRKLAFRYITSFSLISVLLCSKLSADQDQPSPERTAALEVINNVFNGSNFQDDAKPLSLLRATLRNNGASAIALGRNAELLQEASQLFENGISISDLNDRLLSSVSVDVVFSDPRIGSETVGTSLERFTIIRYFIRNGIELTKTDQLSGQRMLRSALALTVSDYADSGMFVDMLVREIDRAKLDTKTVLNCDDEGLESIKKFIGVLELEFSKAVSNLRIDAALKTTKAVKAGIDGRVPLRHVSDALTAIEAYWSRIAMCDDMLVHMTCGFVYRLRSTVALSNDEEDLKRVDEWIDKQIPKATNATSRRWMTEAKTTKPQRFQDSGLHVLTGPNDPMIKGEPPQ